MSNLRHTVCCIAILLCGLFRAAAQDATSAVAIDPDVLAKANAGDPVAQVQAGETCAAASEMAQAAAWYKKAADQNDVPGELRLAVLYRDGGKGFPRDVTQAATWYRKAADQGEPSAQGTLGMLHTVGEGVPRSDVEAYFWLDLAASIAGPNQSQYAANRQVVGTRITVDDLTEIQDRETKWKAAHRRPAAATATAH